MTIPVDDFNNGPYRRLDQDCSIRQLNNLLVPFHAAIELSNITESNQ